MDQNNSNQTMNNNPDTGAKTFTQDQVNAIIGERLAKEKSKSELALVEREKELVKREMQLAAKEKIREMGLPDELVEVLDVQDEEKLNKALSVIQAAINKNKSRDDLKVFEPNKLPKGDFPEEGIDSKLRKAMGLPK